MLLSTCCLLAVYLLSTHCLLTVYLLEAGLPVLPSTSCLLAIYLLSTCCLLIACCDRPLVLVHPNVRQRNY